MALVSNEIAETSDRKTSSRVRRLRLRLRPDRTCRSEEHTSELQSRLHLVCRLLLEKKKKTLYTRSCPRCTNINLRLLLPPRSSQHLLCEPSQPTGAHACSI